MNNVKNYRTKLNITKQELADAVDIHRDYLSMIERNARTPGFRLAKRMADYLGTTLDELFFCSSTE